MLLYDNCMLRRVVISSGVTCPLVELANHVHMPRHVHEELLLAPLETPCQLFAATLTRQ